MVIIKYTVLSAALFSDFLKWQKCQALLKFKKHEREYLQAEGEEPCSSDEVCHRRLLDLKGINALLQ